MHTSAKELAATHSGVLHAWEWPPPLSRSKARSTRTAGDPAGWDVFAAKPGAIVDGHSPAVACDHYHRMPDDVALMKELGIDSYRFSLSWPRIQPSGSGPVNRGRAGLLRPARWTSSWPTGFPPW